MNPAAIIGSAGNATTLIASTYVGDAKIPAITPSATNPLIAQNNGYYFIADTTASQPHQAPPASSQRPALR